MVLIYPKRNLKNEKILSRTMMWWQLKFYKFILVWNWLKCKLGRKLGRVGTFSTLTSINCLSGSTLRAADSRQACPQILCFKSVPRRCECCWSGNCTLSTTVLEKGEVDEHEDQIENVWHLSKSKGKCDAKRKLKWYLNSFTDCIRDGVNLSLFVFNQNHQ